MISVIMLTYNREHLAGRAIESVLAQTYQDFEYIIVDNGSTDGSGRIADEYATKDRRIRVVHRARGNIGSGRNAGLDACAPSSKDHFIAFIDDDDWVEPDYLEFLHRLLTENGADAAICGADGRAFDQKQVMTAEEALIELMWRKKYTMGLPAKLFRAGLWESLRFSETVQYDDIDMMYRLLARTGKVAYHGLPKYHIFRHPGNNSAWTTDHRLLTPETLDEYLGAYRTRTAWLSERFPDSAPAFRYFEWSFLLSMVEKISRLHLTECAERQKTMLQELRLHSREFLSSPHLQEFEREWAGLYLTPAEDAV